MAVRRTASRTWHYFRHTPQTFGQMTDVRAEPVKTSTVRNKHKFVFLAAQGEICDWHLKAMKHLLGAAHIHINSPISLSLF